MPAPSHGERLRILIRCNLADLVAGLKVERPALLRWLVSVVGVVPAYGFARVLLSYDDLVGRAGMVAGADRLLRSFSRGLTIVDADRLPSSGPLIVVANHPGLVDAMALVRALGERPDLRIVAADRDLLRALPQVGARLMYVAAARGGRTGLVRDVVAHLRSGGAVLTFPAGHIEPDPALHPEAAVAALDGWTDSTALFTRRVPEASVVTMAVSGVVSPRARDHLLARRFEQEDRDSVAATLQVLWPPYRDTRATVRIGPPIPGAEATKERLRAAMAELIRAGVPES